MKNVQYQVSVRKNGWVNTIYSKTLYPSLEVAKAAIQYIHGLSLDKKDRYTKVPLDPSIPYVSLCMVENDCTYTSIGFYQ